MNQARIQRQQYKEQNKEKRKTFFWSLDFLGIRVIVKMLKTTKKIDFPRPPLESPPPITP
jgi:hypothetical protein